MEEKSDFIRKLLIVVFKGKKTFFSASIFIILLVLAGSLLMSPIYESSSKILLKQGRFAYRSSQISKHEIETEIAILRTRPLIEKVVTTLELDKLEDDSIFKKIVVFIKSLIPKRESRAAVEVEEKLQREIDTVIKNIDINPIKNSSFVNIAYSSIYPEIAQKVVNAFAQFAAERHAEVYRQEEAYRFFNKEAKSAKELIKELEKKLLLFQKKSLILSVSEEKKSALQIGAELENIKNKTEIRLKELEKSIEIVKSQMNDQKDMISKRVERIHNPVRDKLKEYLNELTLERERIRQKYGSESPLFKDKESEISIVSKNLNKEPSMILGSETEEINETKTRLNSQLLGLAREFEEIKKRHEEVNLKIRDMIQRVNYLNEKEFEIDSLTREIKIGKEKYLLYEKKKEDARIAESLDKENMLNISIVELAPLPLEPIKPRLLMNFFISIIVGAAWGIILIFVQEFFDHSFKTKEDIENILALPVLASISKIEGHRSEGILKMV